MFGNGSAGGHTLKNIRRYFEPMISYSYSRCLFFYFVTFVLETTTNKFGNIERERERKKEREKGRERERERKREADRKKILKTKNDDMTESDPATNESSIFLLPEYFLRV